MELQDHIHKLKYFIKVAEAGSIKGGSEASFLSQPHMTKVMQQLEEATNTKLLTRSKSGVELTKEGAELYQLALSINESIIRFTSKIDSTAEAIKGSVRIGTYDSIARYFFPYFLDYFEARNPDFRLEIKTARSSQIASSLIEKEIDLGIIVNAKNYSPALYFENAYRDSFGLYTATNTDKLKSNRLIYFDFAQNNISSSLKQFNFLSSFCCDNLETVKSLTEQKLGVGLLPHRVAREGVVNGKLIPYRHSKIKSNYFDEHTIDICFNKKAKPEVQFVSEELLRFLRVWSKK